MERGVTAKVGSNFTFSPHESRDRGKGLEPANGTNAIIFTRQSAISLFSYCQA